MERVYKILERLSANLFNVNFEFIFEKDKRGGDRYFIQVVYKTNCTHTEELKEWKGRKFYLSEFMTDDEIVKTCYLAFELAVKHEVMEAFKVDNIILFNPHLNFEELLKISHKEIKRN